MLSVAGTHVAVAQPIRMTGGNQTITLSTGVAGGTLTSVVNTAASLRYKKQAALSKIAVSTSCPGQKFSLSVVATAVAQGVAQPAAQLQNGALALDLVRDIPTAGFVNATCTLQYTASATFDQGTGTDLHTVTYTILAQ